MKHFLKYALALVAAALVFSAPVRAQFVMGTLDTDNTLAADSDQRIPTQKAIKAYIAAHANGFGTLTVTASTGTLTIVNAKTLTASNTLTLAGTDGTTMTFPSTSGTVVTLDATQTLANKTLTAPVIGAATGTSLAVTGLLTSSSASAGIGYATGAGGAVTQATNRATGVTLSKVTGAITTHTASLAAGASATFTVTNTAVAIGDVVNVSIRSGATNKETSVRVTAVAAGSFDLTVFNQHASTAETGAIVINFAVLKAVSS